MKSSNTFELFKVEGLTKSFGKNLAVDNVNLNIRKNEIRAIIGPNGAGKTTFFNLISGNLRSDSGKVYYEGRDITRWKSHRIIKLGISRSFQITSIFHDLTVYENVMVPVLINKKKQLNPFSSAHNINDVRDETISILKLIGMENLTAVKGEALSHGDKKRLEIGIVLACKPKLLLLDEPTAGMSQEETISTVNLIKNLAEELGITIIFTEHDMKVVFSISDVITVLQAGRIIAEGTPDEVKKNKKVIEAYVGKEMQ